MAAEQWTPTGLAQGYYCLRCGKCSNMYGTGHGSGLCESNPKYVKQLQELNTVDAEKHRKFKLDLKYGRK